MGKKGKKSNRKSSGQSNGTSSTAPNTVVKPKHVPFCIPDPPAVSSLEYTDRLPPPPALQNLSYLSNLDDRLDDILSSDRKRYCLPSNGNLSKLKSKTAKRVATALSRFDIVRESLSKLPPNIKEASSPVSMQKLVHNESFLEACVHIVLAMSSTDVRLIPCMHSFVNQWPIPNCYHQSLEYFPLDEGQLQMEKLSIEKFVVLVATILVVGTTDRIPYHRTLKLIHELYLQSKTLDWSKFGSSKHLKSLTETECRNAFTGIAIKVCKTLYRKKQSERLELRLAHNVNLSSRALLREIEVFARDQMRYSKNGNGEFNLAWIATQSSAVLKVDPLSAAADALHWFTKAYTAADKHGDDFVSGAARIDAAGCLLCCGEGVILIPTTVTERLTTRRDFRTAFGEKHHSGIENIDIRRNICNITNEHSGFIALNYEKQRLTSGTSMTELTSGEEHFVEWKKALSLWNEAMKYYDRMVDIGMGYFVFGESAFWMEVIYQIRESVKECDVKKIDFDECDYKNPAVIPGICAPKDKGQRFCANCRGPHGNFDCARCEQVSYCSQECLTAHWKVHKISCHKK